MQKILVTGASGHIGGQVVRELQREGRTPIAFVRASAELHGLSVERRNGDVRDAASVRAAMAGCDAVIHSAAQFSLWARREEEILQPTIEGTRNVVEAAAALGIRRIVYTSSAVTCGFAERADAPHSERDRLDSPAVPYYRAKLEAERLAFSLAAAHKIELVALCPTGVLGAHDYRITPSMRPLLDLANGAGVTFDGGLNVVSVRDVARAHVRALSRGAAGERFLVGGENLTLRDLGKLIGAFVGKTPRHVHWPRWLFSTLAALMELGASMTGRAPAVTRAAVRDLFGKYGYYDCGKARATLGVEPTPAAEVVGEALRWFAERGLLKSQPLQLEKAHG